MRYAALAIAPMTVGMITMLTTQTTVHTQALASPPSAPYVLDHTPSVIPPPAFPGLPYRQGVCGITPIESSHKFPIRFCVLGFLSKYPNPAHCPEFLSCRLLDQQEDAATGIVYRKRHMTMKNTAPWIFRKLLHADTVEFLEESLDDPNHGIFEIYSQNKTFSSILTATEHSKFYKDPQDPNNTKFIQTGGIRCSSWFGPLKTPLESFVTPRMRVAGVRATELLDEILHEKYAEAKAKGTEK